MAVWQPIDLATDPDEPRYGGDPAELVAAMAEVFELLRRPAWHRQAACRGKGTDQWFPASGEDGPTKAVCASCPVRQNCRAVGRGERHGIWAGMSERERGQLRRSA